ncbi:MAG: MBL fold metallo-hydrolase [Clostridia bacterium]|nr:MBL fold metallo-hydrolase [Clostridia bacterium]
MRVSKILPVGFASNSYILTADGKTAVVIDPSEKRILKILKENGLSCKYVLLTHGHFDHVGACGELFSIGAHICCNEREKDLIFSKEYLNIFGGVTVPEFKISRTFKDGEEITLCGINFKVLETPGHTVGSACYVAGDSIFTGDTLFCGSVGRWDLPTGNFTELIKSVKHLAALDGDYKIYAGHGEDTTLSRERAYNPYIRND